MEKLMKSYVVDAFTDKVFKGNPAAVVVLEKWLDDKMMQNIAIENNLSETAFAVPNKDSFELRWFTPGGEVDLCGDATLATAYVITHFTAPVLTRIVFNTQSGKLTVVRKDELFEMDLPAYGLKPVDVTDAMEAAIGYRPLEAWLARDLVCVLADEQQVINAKPDMEKLKALDGMALNITARGSAFDCVTRSFVPKLNIPEDPVCGSCHCHVIPLWAEKTGRDTFTAYQASARSGVLYCRMDGKRVKIAGKAALYAIAEIFLPQEE